MKRALLTMALLPVVLGGIPAGAIPAEAALGSPSLSGSGRALAAVQTAAPGWYVAAKHEDRRRDEPALSLALKLEKRGTQFQVTGKLGYGGSTNTQVPVSGTYYPSTKRLKGTFLFRSPRKGNVDLPLDGKYNPTRNAFEVELAVPSMGGNARYTFVCVGAAKAKLPPTALYHWSDEYGEFGLGVTVMIDEKGTGFRGVFRDYRTRHADWDLSGSLSPTTGKIVKGIVVKRRDPVAEIYAKVPLTGHWDDAAQTLVLTFDGMTYALKTLPKSRPKYELPKTGLWRSDPLPNGLVAYFFVSQEDRPEGQRRAIKGGVRDESVKPPAEWRFMSDLYGPAFDAKLNPVGVSDDGSRLKQVFGLWDDKAQVFRVKVWIKDQPHVFVVKYRD